MDERVSISELKDAYVICRALGHSWDDWPQGEVDRTMLHLFQGALVLRCTRCTTERYDYIGKDMRVAQRTYKYPPMYKSIPGEGTRPNLRGEMFRRSLLIRTFDSNVVPIQTSKRSRKRA